MPAPPPKHAKGSRAPRQKLEQEADALKELEELEALEKFQRPEVARPASRPNTPKLSSSSNASSNRRGPGVITPSSTASARTSEDKPTAPRKSGESARSFHQSFVPTQEDDTAQAAPEPKQEPQQAGGSWWGGGWGGLISTATAAADAAKKQAEAAYQEIQKNQEAQRWAEQVRGNVGALRGIGTSMQIRTFKLLLIIQRRRAGKASTPHVYQHPTHTCTADFTTRTPTDPHHTRPHRLPFT